jgi:hypothetical protein
MTPRELFGVIVRTGALLSCAYGLSVLVETGWRFLLVLVFQDVSQYPVSTLVLNLAPGIGWFAAGLLALLGADRIVRLAYRGRRAGVCENCGYDLRGSPGRCPECGTATPTPPA